MSSRHFPVLRGHVFPRIGKLPAERETEHSFGFMKAYPVESLPSIEEAEKLVAVHRKLIERSLKEARYATKLGDLKHSQQKRRTSGEREGRSCRSVSSGSTGPSVRTCEAATCTRCAKVMRPGIATARQGSPRFSGGSTVLN